MNLVEQIQASIKKNDFDTAYSAMEHFSISEKVELLFNRIILYDHTSMYLFLLYLIAKGEDTAEWNYRCFVYLVFESSLCNDSMCLAAWHAKNALNLDGGNLEYQKSIFSVFASYPEQFFAHEELVEMAKNIVSAYPDCCEASEFLNK